MSIATNEAEKRYPRDVALTATSENNICRRTGYIAGRTAEPTEAEIKAAVRAMYYRHAADWESDEDYARYLLDAARKAVSE